MVIVTYKKASATSLTGFSQYFGGAVRNLGFKNILYWSFEYIIEIITLYCKRYAMIPKSVNVFK